MGELGLGVLVAMDSRAVVKIGSEGLALALGDLLGARLWAGRHACLVC